MYQEFETIYRNFDANLRKFIGSRVNDPQTAEDVLQEVYLKIRRNIDGLRDTDRMAPWLFQITRNAIVDQYRRRRPEVALSENLAEDQLESPDVFEELAPSVRSILECLPDPDRQALELADLQGLRQKKVAQVLGLSLSGAKSRIQRARHKLKQIFLACCQFEFDQRGQVVDFQPNCDQGVEETCNNSGCEGI